MAFQLFRIAGFIIITDLFSDGCYLVLCEDGVENNISECSALHSYSVLSQDVLYLSQSYLHELHHHHQIVSL